MTYDEFIAQAPRYEPPTDFDAWMAEYRSRMSDPQVLNSLREAAILNYAKLVHRRQKLVQGE